MDAHTILNLDDDEFKHEVLKASQKVLNKVFIRLAEQGRNNLLLWLANDRHFNLDIAMWAACNHRRTDTMNILYGLGAKMKAGYFVSAVLKNWVDMAMWLYTIDNTCIDEYMKDKWFYLMVPICNNRQMAMLSWLLEHFQVDRQLLVSVCIHEDVKRFLLF